MDNITSKLESLKVLHQINETMKAATPGNLNYTVTQLFLRAITCIAARIYTNESAFRKISAENYCCSGDTLAENHINALDSTWIVQSITNLCVDNAFTYNQDPDINDLYDIEEKDELFQEIGFIEFANLSGETLDYYAAGQKEECDGNCKQCKFFKQDVIGLFDNVCCHDAVSTYLMKHYVTHEESSITQESYIGTISSFLMDTSLHILGIAFDSGHDKIDNEEIVRGQFALLFAWGFYWMPYDFSGHISIFYNSHSLGVLKYCKEIKEGNISDAELTEEERALAIYCYETLSQFSLLADESERYAFDFNSPASSVAILPDGFDGEFILLMENHLETNSIKHSSLSCSLLQEYLAIVDAARLTFGERIEKFCKERSNGNLK